MPRRSAPSRTQSTTSTSTHPDDPADLTAAGDPPTSPAATLAARIGVPLGSSDLLFQALVHSSWLHEHPDAATDHNERLEFLGDAVVNLVVSSALYRRHPTDDEGFLSARRAAIVSTVGLARLADHVGLGAYLLLGEGEASRGGRSRPALLASAFEAVVGALYLELGFEQVRAWLLDLAAAEISEDLPAGKLKSPKSRLQEYTQRTTGGRPFYRLLDATGPDHQRTFQIAVEIDGRVLGEGTGPSRRVAETAAAVMALDAIQAEAQADSRVDPAGA
jgi:ribonuclease-3